MKNEETKKITALGVVIFSFASVILFLLIQLVFDMITALIVLKTNVPENAINLGSAIGTGVGLVVSGAFAVAFGKIKGIVATAVLSVSVILIKVIGNAIMGCGGYLNLKGLIGIVFVLIFSFIGAVVGTRIK